ncbi:Uncharacterized protein APZ42_021830 [Daphnia magna]|uniref:Uncharacterized protein n=1 Tax=Daphnia magna TaxID=35525 RepID=A0A164WA01_9CRUS|nr:Uncharacterized protein APZ42_021830 [Daphnia magna]
MSLCSKLAKVGAKVTSSSITPPRHAYMCTIGSRWSSSPAASTTVSQSPRRARRYILFYFVFCFFFSFHYIF